MRVSPPAAPPVPIPAARERRGGRRLLWALVGPPARLFDRVNGWWERPSTQRAGGLTLVPRPREPVLVLNGDILTTLDFGAMYAFHRGRAPGATIASYTRGVKIDFGVLDFGDDPHVLAGYREKPEFTFQVSMGLYILDPSAWDYLAPGEPLDLAYDAAASGAIRFTLRAGAREVASGVLSAPPATPSSAQGGAQS